MEEIMAIFITKKVYRMDIVRTTSDLHLCKGPFVIPYWWGLNYRGFVYTESHTRENLTQASLQIVFSSRGAPWATPPLHIVRSQSHFGMCDTEGLNFLSPFLCWLLGSLLHFTVCLFIIFSLVCVGGGHCKDTCVSGSQPCVQSAWFPPSLLESVWQLFLLSRCLH